MNLIKNNKFGTLIGFCAIAVATLPSAQGTTSFTNGNFNTLNCLTLVAGETCTNGTGQLAYNTDATGWANGTTGNIGYTFLFAPTTEPATTVATTNPGAVGVDGALELWGSGNDSDDPTNTLTGSAVPGGGDLIASDGAYEVDPLTQAITGLISGDTYIVGFWWAGAQQEGVNFTEPTTEQWEVSLGSQEQSTAFVSDNGEGFTGWMYQTYEFTANAASETLAFLANGTPNSSEPPFVLLADVSFNQLPEPGTSSMMLGGFGLIGLGLIKLRNRPKR
jgi:hypothetical protein